MKIYIKAGKETPVLFSEIHVGTHFVLGGRKFIKANALIAGCSETNCVDLSTGIMGFVHQSQPVELSAKPDKKISIDKITLFRDIAAGVVFLYRNRAFLKIAHHPRAYSDILFKAVDLRACDVAVFDDATKVTPCDCTAVEITPQQINIEETK